MIKNHISRWVMKLKHELNQPINKLAVCISFIIFIFSCDVIYGLINEKPQSIQLLSDMVGMVFNTALCFSLASLGQIIFYGSQNKYKKEILIISGSIISLFSLLILSQYFIQLPFNVDQVFFKGSILDSNPFPGRMAPNTAISFILIGMIFILLTLVHKKLFVTCLQILNGLIYIIGLTGFMAYFIDLGFLFNWYTSVRMALYTSIGMMLLSLSFWGYWKDSKWLNEYYHNKEYIRLTISAIFIQLGVTFFAGLTGEAILVKQEKKFLRIS